MGRFEEGIVREEVALDCIHVRDEVGCREEVHETTCMVSLSKTLGQQPSPETYVWKMVTKSSRLIDRSSGHKKSRAIRAA